MLAQCSPNVIQHWPSPKPAPGTLAVGHCEATAILANPNVGLMLGHRLRRRPNIEPTVFQCMFGSEKPDW